MEEQQTNVIANPARAVSAATFAQTLDRLRNRPDVTEKEFATTWLEEMRSHESVSANGWYDPPPNGIAVLGGLDRISFNSLRDEGNWPGSRVIDFHSGALYAYSSQVNTVDAMPGDFAATLYFGDDPKIRSHFRRTYAATQEVLEVALRESSSRVIFDSSVAIFEKYGLQNCVVSYTDTVPLDLGHTYPVVDEVELGANKQLVPVDQDRIRHARLFLNGDSDWSLDSCAQFTIEPQLIDVANPDLPQVTYHYVVIPGESSVLREQDSLLESLGLMP
ncbi:hypothetical protein ACQPYE_39915 [Actinosynnema sp. CA-299493]